MQLEVISDYRNSICYVLILCDYRYVSSMLLDMQEYLETKKQISSPEKEWFATVRSNTNAVREVMQNYWFRYNASTLNSAMTSVVQLQAQKYNNNWHTRHFQFFWQINKNESNRAEKQGKIFIIENKKQGMICPQNKMSTFIYKKCIHIRS